MSCQKIGHEKKIGPNIEIVKFCVVKKKAWVIVDTSFFLGSLIRTRTGSFANVFPGMHLGNIKVGQISVLSQNGSWSVVDARNSLFLNFSQFDLFFPPKMIKIGFFPHLCMP